MPPTTPSTRPTRTPFDTAGPRPANEVARRVMVNQGVAREAVHAELRIDELQSLGPFRIVETEAPDKQAHLNSPDRGADCLRGACGNWFRKAGRCNC